MSFRSCHLVIISYGKLNILIDIFKKFSINIIFIIYILDSLILVQPINSKNIYKSNNHSLSSEILLKSNSLTKNKPILKTYGPLILDLNNLGYYSGIFIIPMLNKDFKPLFLAINCKESIFNIKDKSNWRDWFTPFFTYELNILNDFCSN